MELKQVKRYTYGDYKQWTEGRWEIIDGRVYDMSPAPTVRHQQIVGRIYTDLASFLKDKPCQPYLSPLDVRFEEDDDADTVVQPDVLVVCDRSKLRRDGIVGAPDVVFEVLSPRSSTRDLIKKYNLYERRGVREYWVVNPDEKVVIRFTLAEGRFVQGDDAPVLESQVLPGFSLDSAALFAALDGLPMDMAGQ